MLIGEIISTLSSWGIKIRHPLWPICWNGVITSTLSSWGFKIRHLLRTICWLGKKKQLYLHEGSTFATPSEQYVDWDNNTNFIFMRDQNSPSPMALWPMLNGVITSTFSSWGIKIRKAGHQLRANVQVAAKMFQHSHFSDIGFGSHGGTTKLDQIRPYVVLKAFERHGFG